jgi:hypothetical protein
MKLVETGPKQLMATLAACGLLISLTLIPIIHYQMAPQPEPLPVVYQ